MAEERPTPGKPVTGRPRPDRQSWFLPIVGAVVVLGAIFLFFAWSDNGQLAGQAELPASDMNTGSVDDTATHVDRYSTDDEANDR